MVAKSYQSLKIVGEPFLSKGRQYVQVETKSGALKTVRFYTEAEYKRMYPGEEIPEPIGKRIRTEKEVLGFSQGFITIFKGNTYEDKEYFKESAARYTRMWGWYFTSEQEVPDDLPNDVEAVRLNWELVGNEDGTLKFESQIATAIDSLIYEPDISEYQGEIGERIEVIVTVEKTVALDGYYGPSTCYSMKDIKQNIYTWITSSTKTTLEEGRQYTIRGTVKEHKTYKGKKQTVLSRCVVTS